MLPILVLVGRPNVGKSTLFNRLTKSRAALVADFPGLTRDRHYGRGHIGERRFIVVDTGGFEPVAKTGILHEMAKQTRAAIAEADAVIFLVDGRAGLTEQDRTIARLLRKSGRPVFLVVNKVEGLLPGRATAEFHELALGEPYGISAAHGENVSEVTELALASIPVAQPDDEPTPGPDIPIKVAVIGRPNVGKSTLVNTLLGEERVIAFDEPGTTRDSIYLDFEKNGRRYTLIDTAGVRRRGKVFEAVEKFSVVKTLQAIEDANVVVLMFDADEGVTEQDAHLAGYILEAGRALVVAINKWDARARGAPRRGQARPRSQGGLSFVCAPALHFGQDGHRCGERDALGRRRVRGRHGETADAQVDPGARDRRRAPAAPEGGQGPAQASLRPPGRTEPAAGGDSRHGALPHPGVLQALSGTFLRRGVPTSRNAP